MRADGQTQSPSLLPTSAAFINSFLLHTLPTMQLLPLNDITRDDMQLPPEPHVLFTVVLVVLPLKDSNQENNFTRTDDYCV